MLGKCNKIKAVRLWGEVSDITPSTICPSMPEIRVRICLNSMKITLINGRKFFACVQQTKPYRIQIHDNDICVIHVIRLFAGWHSLLLVTKLILRNETRPAREKKGGEIMITFSYAWESNKISGASFCQSTDRIQQSRLQLWNMKWLHRKKSAVQMGHS